MIKKLLNGYVGKTLVVVFFSFVIASLYPVIIAFTATETERAISHFVENPMLWLAVVPVVGVGIYCALGAPKQ